MGQVGQGGLGQCLKAGGPHSGSTGALCRAQSPHRDLGWQVCSWAGVLDLGPVIPPRKGRGVCGREGGDSRAQVSGPGQGLRVRCSTRRSGLLSLLVQVLACSPTPHKALPWGFQSDPDPG